MIRFFPGYTSSIPLNHARIGYESYPATVESGDPGLTYGPDVVTNENTYERWDPFSGGVMVLDLGAIKLASYLAIAAHSLAGFNVKIEQGGDNIGYGTLFDDLETSNNPLIFVFNEVNIRYIRITISGGQIGVVYSGRILEMLRGAYAGHSPVNLSRNTVKNLNRSIRGQFLGTSIVRTGLSASYQFSNIPIDWYEANIDPMAESARTRPVFIAWNPLEHPDQTAYGYVQEDIKPTLSGTINLCDFEFSLDAYN